MPQIYAIFAVIFLPGVSMQAKYLHLNRIFITIFFICPFFFSASFHASLVSDTSALLKVYFLYGSKPKFKYRHTEKREFGGLHGGHVSLVINGEDIGFERANGLHVFSHRNNKKAQFRCRLADLVLHEHKNSKVAVVHIPLGKSQFSRLQNILSVYRASLPYDYAFFGMRCAASTSEILSQIGLVKKRKRIGHILHAFYPRPFRRSLLRKAQKQGWLVSRQPGRTTRKWEKD